MQTVALSPALEAWAWNEAPVESVHERWLSTGKTMQEVTWGFIALPSALSAGDLHG